MHEMSLIGGVLRILEEERARRQFTTVRRVILEVGALSHADPEALRFAWEAARAGTTAAGATLEIQATPGAGYCVDCGEAVAVPARGTPCPRCGGFHILLQAGEELRVKALEVA